MAGQRVGRRLRRRGGPGAASGIGGYHQVAGRFTVPGSGDIAPLIARPLNDRPNISIRDYFFFRTG